MINKEETMEKVKQLWATVLAHKKISIAVAVVIVLLILYQKNFMLSFTGCWERVKSIGSQLTLLKHHRFLGCDLTSWSYALMIFIIVAWLLLIS